jgi:hypothetical protein
MEWFKVWTGIRDDPDVLRLTDKEFRAWMCILDYCADRETDGVYVSVGRAPAWLAGLVQKGRLIPQDEPNVYLVKGWENRQKSRAELEDLRAKRQQAGSKGGRTRRANRKQTGSKTQPDLEVDLDLEVEKDLEQPPSAQARKRDPLFDALASVDGSDPKELTESAATACGVALAQIRKATPSVTPDEIAARAKNYTAKMPQAALTPSALSRHWAAMAKTNGHGRSSTWDNPL